MKFFDVTKKIACGAYVAGLSSVMIHQSVENYKKRKKMIKENPGAGYTFDHMPLGPYDVISNERMVDKETGETVARINK